MGHFIDIIYIYIWVILELDHHKSSGDLNIPLVWAKDAISFGIWYNPFWQIKQNTSGKWYLKLRANALRANAHQQRWHSSAGVILERFDNYKSSADLNIPLVPAKDAISFGIWCKPPWQMKQNTSDKCYKMFWANILRANAHPQRWRSSRGVIL